MAHGTKADVNNEKTKKKGKRERLVSTLQSAFFPQRNGTVSLNRSLHEPGHRGSVALLDGDDLATDGFWTSTSDLDVDGNPLCAKRPGSETKETSEIDESSPSSQDDRYPRIHSARRRVPRGRDLPGREQSASSPELREWMPTAVPTKNKREKKKKKKKKKRKKKRRSRVQHPSAGGKRKSRKSKTKKRMSLDSTILEIATSTSSSPSASAFVSKLNMDKITAMQYHYDEKTKKWVATSIEITEKQARQLIQSARTSRDEAVPNRIKYRTSSGKVITKQAYEARRLHRLQTVLHDEPYVRTPSQEYDDGTSDMDTSERMSLKERRKEAMVDDELPLHNTSSCVVCHQTVPRRAPSPLRKHSFVEWVPKPESSEMEEDEEEELYVDMSVPNPPSRKPTISYAPEGIPYAFFRDHENPDIIHRPRPRSSSAIRRSNGSTDEVETFRSERMQRLQARRVPDLELRTRYMKKAKELMKLEFLVYRECANAPVGATLVIRTVDIGDGVVGYEASKQVDGKWVEIEFMKI